MYSITLHYSNLADALIQSDIHWSANQNQGQYSEDLRGKYSSKYRSSSDQLDKLENKSTEE